MKQNNEICNLIAKIIYERLYYVYCDNCRFNSDRTKWHDNEENPCEDCHRKYMNWAISMETANQLAEIIATIKEME